MISKSSLQPGAELTDRTAAQRAAGHFQLTVTRLAHPAGVSACSLPSREQGFGRTRHNLASQDTRLSPGRPGVQVPVADYYCNESKAQRLQHFGMRQPGKSFFPEAA